MSLNGLCLFSRIRFRDDEDIEDDEYNEEYIPLSNLTEVAANIVDADEHIIHTLHLFFFSETTEDYMARNNILNFRGFSCHSIYDLGIHHAFLLRLTRTRVFQIAQIMLVETFNIPYGRLLAEIIDVCNGPFTRLLRRHEYWHIPTRSTIYEYPLKREDIFEDFRHFLEEKKENDNKVKDLVEKLETFPVNFKRKIEALRSGFNTHDLCKDFETDLMLISILIHDLIKIIENFSAEFVEISKESWKPVINDILVIIAHIHFFKRRCLVTKEEALDALEWESWELPIVNQIDIVFCWFKFVSELGELSKMASMNKNYYFPYEAYRIMLRFLKMHYYNLPECDSGIDEKLQNVRASFSQVLTVIYDAKVKMGVDCTKPTILDFMCRPWEI